MGPVWRALGRSVGHGIGWLVVWVWPAWRLVEAMSAAAWVTETIPQGLASFLSAWGWFPSMAVGFLVLHLVDRRQRAISELETHLIQFLRRLSEFDATNAAELTVAGEKRVWPARRQMLISLTDVFTSLVRADRQPKNAQAMLNRVAEGLKRLHPEIPEGGDFNLHDALSIGVGITLPKDRQHSTAE